MIFSTGPLNEVGRIIKTHGYEGKLRFELFHDIEIDIKEPVFMMFDHKPVPFFITEISKSNPYIVAIEGIKDLDRAQHFLNKSVYLPILDETDNEEDDFIGFEVFDVTLGKLGVVKSVMENAAQDIIVVDYQQRELMIPFVDALIESFDEDARTIVFRLPDGLINIDETND